MSPKETFWCSLGVDPAVRITYHPQSKKKRRTGSLLNAKTNVTTFEQAITMKNTRRTPITCLRISEKIPLSESDSIKVNLLEPSGLATSRGKVVLRDNVRARWVKPSESAPEDIDDSSLEDVDMKAARGLFEWICDIGPSKTLDVSLVWEVVAPIGVDWRQETDY